MDNEIPSGFRAIFIDLFKESYLINDFKYMGVDNACSAIKLSSNIKCEDSMLRVMFK